MPAAASRLSDLHLIALTLHAEPLLSGSQRLSQTAGRDAILCGRYVQWEERGAEEREAGEQLRFRPRLRPALSDGLELFGDC